MGIAKLRKPTNAELYIAALKHAEHVTWLERDAYTRRGMPREAEAAGRVAGMLGDKAWKAEQALERRKAARRTSQTASPNHP